MRKVIIDFDGTLTAEEEQAELLANLSLTALATEILGVPLPQLTADYQRIRARLQQAPHQYRWEVNGQVASYSDEGAFILNTTTMQAMLRENPDYRQVVQAAFPNPEYDSIVDCTNYLFHRHTAELPITFRPAARDVLTTLIKNPNYQPVILTNSLADKVERHIAALNLASPIAILGDTRQYDMAADCPCHFPALGKRQIWSLDEKYEIDLRRPAYHRALLKETADGSQLAVVADTFSMPGAMPLMMGIPFFLTRTDYTPAWCLDAVASHPFGHVLEDLADLPAALDMLPLLQS